MSLTRKLYDIKNESNTRASIDYLYGERTCEETVHFCKKTHELY